MATPHRPYEHVHNSRGCTGDELVIVEEKVDGSNFYFATDGKETVCGRRNGILREDEKFYGFQRLFGLRENAVGLFARLRTDPPAKLMYLYGELIPTQKRIKYVAAGDPNAYFIAFDLALVGDDDVVSYVPKALWEDAARDCGFLVIPTIAICAAKEAAAIDVEERVSAVPRLVDPRSELVSPIEGIVFKSADRRLVRKKKAAAFAESASFVRDASQSLRDRLIGELRAMVTVNRLDNVVSNIGDALVPDPPRLANEVVRDAIREAQAESDEDAAVRTATTSMLGKVQKLLAKEFEANVKTHMNWS